MQFDYVGYLNTRSKYFNINVVKSVFCCKCMLIGVL